MIKKISMGVARNGFDQSGHGALNLAVPQELIDGVNGFFAWCKFRTAKSDFNGFWIGLVKNGCSHLVHEALKSVEEVYALSCFFACWLWFNNFLSDQHDTFYFWLLNPNLLQLYLLAPWQQLEGSYEIGSVHPSLLTSIWVFSWNLIIRFLLVLPVC